MNCYPTMAYSTIRIDFAKRRITRRMNASASTILRCWLMYHRNFPYPSILEKTILSLLTGLSNSSNYYTFFFFFFFFALSTQTQVIIFDFFISN